MVERWPGLYTKFDNLLVGRNGNGELLINSARIICPNNIGYRCVDHIFRFLFHSDFIKYSFRRILHIHDLNTQ